MPRDEQDSVTAVRLPGRWGDRHINSNDNTVKHVWHWRLEGSTRRPWRGSPVAVWATWALQLLFFLQTWSQQSPGTDRMTISWRPHGLLLLHVITLRNLLLSLLNSFYFYWNSEISKICRNGQKSDQIDISTRARQIETKELCLPHWIPIFYEGNRAPCCRSKAILFTIWIIFPPSLPLS